MVSDLGAAAARGEREVAAGAAAKVDAAVAERNEAVARAAALDAKLQVRGFVWRGMLCRMAYEVTSHACHFLRMITPLPLAPAGV